MGTSMFVSLTALYEFKAGRPSVYGLCKPEEDLALMVGFVTARNNMSAKEAAEHEKEYKAKNQPGKKGKRGPRR